jgi:hypothetical protein
MADARFGSAVGAAACGQIVKTASGPKPLGDAAKRGAMTFHIVHGKRA